MGEQTPDPKLIDSMAMRYRHDFGLLDEPQKEAIRTTMKQLWEEVVGLGFYKPRTAQQTAVEFLIESIDADARGLWTKELRKKAEQAKQMFEEQVKDGFLECWKSNVPVGVECKLDAQQYYNETYGNNQNK